jgi:hypothetical protein
MSNPMSEYRKLAGLKNLHEYKNWRLEEEPTFKVGDVVQVSEDAGTDSNKRGKVLSIDGGWAQIRTSAKEMLWLPNSKLVPKTEARASKMR